MWTKPQEVVRVGGGDGGSEGRGTIMKEFPFLAPSGQWNVFIRTACGTTQ